MKKIIVSIAAVAALSSSVFAGNNQTGCGLGNMAIPGEPKSALIGAIQAFLNHAITFNQTFGITSGTSGCKKTKIVMNERAEEFVASNMDQLAKEIAMGHGESVDTLAELLAVEDKEAFASTLQSNYNSIYSADDVKMAEVLDTISAS